MLHGSKRATFLLAFIASCGYAQTVTAPTPGTPNTVPLFSGSATLTNSTITETNGMVGIGNSSPSATLDVSGTSRFHGGITTFGSGTMFNLGEAYLMTASLAGSNSGITVDRGDTTSFGSIDILTGANINTGWSLQMQPNGTALNFVDRATSGQPNLMVLRPGTVEVGGALVSDGAFTIKGQGGVTFSDGTTQSTAFTGVVCGGDYAESVDVTGDRTHYEPGDLLVIDPNVEGKFLKSAQPYSTSVTGIYSTKPGVIGRRQLTDRSNIKDEVPMAMTGIVPTKVSAENGAIKPGDLLVTSSRLGYAMKGTDRSLMLGAVIGKALGHLDSGTGMIEVVVTLQ